jgi:hypothetical protein
MVNSGDISDPDDPDTDGDAEESDTSGYDGDFVEPKVRGSDDDEESLEKKVYLLFSSFLVSKLSRGIYIYM